MSFSHALIEMRCGNRVSRYGWNGKGMFLFTISGDWEFTTDIEGVQDLPTMPFICMKTATNDLVPWLASQTDLLADDWGIVESEPT